MLEICGDGYLREESLGAEHRAELGLENLERDFALVPDVSREVDGGHFAGADLALDGVAIREGGLEGFE